MSGPMVGAAGMIIPLLFFAVWLGLVVYLLVLATRLVQAVEKIADRIVPGTGHA